MSRSVTLPPRTTVPAAGYGSAWLRAFLHRGSGLDFDEGQAAQIAALAERKLVDLFDVAEATAITNGRARILRHDLPLTKGLQRLEPSDMSTQERLERLLRYLPTQPTHWELDRAGRILDLTV